MLNCRYIIDRDELCEFAGHNTRTVELWDVLLESQGAMGRASTVPISAGFLLEISVRQFELRDGA